MRATLPSLLASLTVVLGFVIASPHVDAQDTGGTRPNPTGAAGGLTREQMWPAPTAADWEKPCLITWQRTYEDALAVSRETGKPILVCVNMDGEIASEHYAGIRYRQPEITALYEPYVTVIASVYRHTPRDHDEYGRRILCPRFGSVTCGEHISIEPGLYDKFLDGQRVAPRHIGVEQDGQEMYDVYYAFDTDSVFAAIRDGIEQRPPVDQPPPRGDRPLAERVASPDVTDRMAVETAYLEGTRPQRQLLLQAAADSGAGVNVDLLRLAIFGTDPALAAQARAALAASSSPKAVDLIVEVLAEPLLPEVERGELLAALDRLGAASPRARRLAVVHRGLSGASSSIDVTRWVSAVETDAAPRPAYLRTRFEAPLEKQDEILAGDDPAAHLDLAEAFLEFAYEQYLRDPEYANLLFIDAATTARAAERLGAYGWRLDATLSIAAYYLGEWEEAHVRAIEAVEGGLPQDAQDWNSMAVLATFAQARQEALRAKLRAGEELPGDWVTDVHAACLVLARHPHGTEEQVVAHHDFLNSLGAYGEAAQILDESLERYPDSWELHDRLRRRILRSRGHHDLEAEYERLMAEADASPHLPYFAGYAALVAAEFTRRTGGDASEALLAYDRAMALFELDIERHPESREDADHFIALAHGGKARVLFEQDDDAGALREVLASFARREASAATLDGLNISTVDTAKMLRARLSDLGDSERLASLAAALEALDPKLLELPAYERSGPSDDARDQRRRPWRRQFPRGQ